VYGDVKICWLQKDAAKMLARAADALRKTHPELRLHAYDCARPLRVQREMWKIVKGTKHQPYVADPDKGSMHNFGCAVDLTLARQAGAALDMGTPFDFFGPAAHVDGEAAMRDDGTLTADQLANRLILREVMVRAGFRPLANEWWHFDCASHADTRKRYSIIP
jgi:D-alanyl-D-alanine dipeptidase